MEPDEIRQMFLDAAALQKAGPLSPGRAEAEERFALLAARYEAECLAARPAPAAEKAEAPEWKSALQYLAGVLRQMDAAVPETAPMNKAVWDVVAPAVQKHYEGEKPGKNEEPDE